MGYSYMQRRRPEARPDSPVHGAREQGPSLQALQAGAAPTREQLGSEVDLPGAIRAKMEDSFGADLSSVRIYESQAVADAGAQAMAMGDRIAFAPGELDFTSTAGQSLLGHEVSHVVSQARGEVSGAGFLNDSALEARADREGALAAAGESVYTGPVAPLSASSVSSAAGPMQAKKFKDKVNDLAEKSAIPYYDELQMDDYDSQYSSFPFSEDNYREVGGLLDTEGKRKKFAKQLLSQRMSGAKGIKAARDSATAQYGTGLGILHARYSKPADNFVNYSRLYELAKGSEYGPQLEEELGRQSAGMKPQDLRLISAVDKLMFNPYGDHYPRSKVGPDEQERFDSERSSLRMQMYQRFLKRRS